MVGWHTGAVRRGARRLKAEIKISSRSRQDLVKSRAGATQCGAASALASAREGKAGGGLECSHGPALTAQWLRSGSARGWLFTPFRGGLCDADD